MLRTVFTVLLLVTALQGCVTRTPDNRENLCEFYRQNPSWYRDSVAAAKRWKGPIDVPMAIMAQESAFQARAKPPIRFFLGIIPYGRPSDAYGYPQALDSTWATYKAEAGSFFSKRSNFDDSIDFIQWYMYKSWTINQVDRNDAFAHYLNYHEGQGGYRRGTWRNKQWLIKTARRVETRSNNYRAQLASCDAELRRML